jgi:hypothetical protein
MNNQQIIELASLVLAVDQNPDDEALVQRLEAGLDQLQSSADGIRVMLATKLLAGEPYSVVSNNPASVQACRSLAAHMGASVIEGDRQLGARTFYIEPAMRQ